MPLYAVHGSELHLVLPEDFADAVNRAQDVWRNSFAAKSGGKYYLKGAEEKSDMDAWVKFARLFNQLIEINGGALKLPNEMQDAPILVKLSYIGEP